MELYVVTLRKVCISMNINTISYWIAEAASSLIKNKKIVITGVVTMVLALFFISFLYVAYVSANSLMDVIKDSQGKIEVFLQDIDEAQTENVKNTIMSVPGVDSVQYISKEEAKERAKERVPAGITTGVPDDIYPASFIVTINKLDDAEKIARSFREIEGVGEEDNDIMVNENSGLISKIVITIKVVSVTIFILAVVAACFIKMNSIKLMLYSRRREISIMKYVGATDTFTKAPFVIEALMISLISAVIVIAITGMLCNSLTDLSTNAPMFSFLKFSDESMSTLTIILLVLSAFIGTVGSSASISKYLDV